MKLRPAIASARRQSGIMLTECLVYMAVFTVLAAIGMGAFYFCWDHTRAVIFTADEIESALRAGEGWRADVRATTGKIFLETTPAGAVAHIPAGEKEIFYRCVAGELLREIAGQNSSHRCLARVKSSEMKIELRGGVTAWRWELELTPRRKEANFPLRFTFEAVPPKP